MTSWSRYVLTKTPQQGWNDRNGTIVCKKEEGVNRDYSIHHTADLALLISSFVGKKLLSPDPRLQLCFSIIVDNTLKSI